MLDVLKHVRARYPAKQPIQLILDNFSPHRKAEVLRWCVRNNVHLIQTPTNASWLNPTERRFTAVKELVIRNTYYRHEALADALRRYSNYRNAESRTKP